MPPPRQALLRGARDALPFFLIIVPFAMLFGVVATDAGLSPFEVSVFSLTVFAGASQFAALQLMLDQAPVLVILATSLAVNLRLVMYSMAIAPHFGSAPLRMRAAIAYFLVDQSFALSVAEFEKRPGMSLNEKLAYFFGAVAPVTVLWFGATLLGAQMGQAIPTEYALDFAVPITFLALTAPMLRSLAHLVAAGVSVAVTLTLVSMPFGTGLLVAAILAMAAGAGVEIWQERRRAA